MGFIKLANGFDFIFEQAKPDINGPHHRLNLFIQGTAKVVVFTMLAETLRSQC